MYTDIDKLKSDITAIRRTIGILIAETEGGEKDRTALLTEIKKLVDQSSASLYHAQRRDNFGASR
jgi:hypothetical protein